MPTTKKRFDKLAHVRAIARNVVGTPKAGQTILPKNKKRKPKYRPHYLDDLLSL